jgi:hypothetical protein
MNFQNTLILDHVPRMDGGAMILGFTGWMDGAEVSTGAVTHLIKVLGGRPMGEIRSGHFYILNVPGSMEITSLFRPATRIENGIVQSLDMPRNDFWAAESSRFVLFRGKEPNVGWELYADHLLDVATRCGLTDMYFLGSVGSVVPHTREPIFWSTMTSEPLRDRLTARGVTPTNYEGPASFATYLSLRAREAGLNMATLVAGIPSYIEGRNPRCIQAMLAKLSEVTGVPFDLSELDAQRSEFLQGVQIAMEKNPKLAERIKQLEKLYDDEVNGTGEASDEPKVTDDAALKNWFERQNIKLD